MDIREKIAHWCEQAGYKCSLGKEDGFTWLTVYGGDINPKSYDSISQQIASIAGVNFYFSVAGINHVEGALDFNFTTGQAYSLYSDTIEQYGHCFRPQP